MYLYVYVFLFISIYIYQTYNVGDEGIRTGYTLLNENLIFEGVGNGSLQLKLRWCFDKVYRCIYVCMYVCKCVCVYASIYVCKCVCMKI
jgi:hypothetical protein